jgi:NADPH:quinone reductase
VLIAIDTAGVGSWDASIRDGSWRTPGRPRFPLVPGVDGARIVAQAHRRLERGRVLGRMVLRVQRGRR